MEGPSVFNAPPRNLHPQLEESLVTFKTDGVEDLLTVLPALHRPIGNIGNLASRSRHEEVSVDRQAAMLVASCEKCGESCSCVDAGVREGATCSDDSIPVIETLEVLRKTCEDVIW